MENILKTFFTFPLDLIFSNFKLRSYGESPKGTPRRDSRPGGQDDMILSSSQFEHNGYIPSKYTCDGENINPPLDISNVPEEAVSLVLIVHDPDAPVPGGWTHWTILDLDPKTTHIEEDSVPANVVQTMTNFGMPGYGGPCPPSGTHHYEFKLWALDSRLMLGESAKKEDIEHALEGHVLARTVLIGLYERNR